ncbi:hypothetical protein [Microbacterium sp. KNMS]
MKRATLATTITAAAVLVGGGAIGAYALSTQDSPAPVETIAATETPAPDATPSAVPTAEPTPTGTPTPSPSPTHSAGEEGLILMTQTRDLANLELSADEILEQAQIVCAARAQGDYDTVASFSGATKQQLEQFATDAGYYVCAEYAD